MMDEGKDSIDGDESLELSHRRPLKTRSWKLFQTIASRLSQTSITPNMISVSSVIFALFAGLALAATSQTDSALVRASLYLGAAVAIQLRLIANLLDGMVAVEGGKKSSEGMLFNEVPDRIADVLIFVGAGYSLGSRPELGLWAAIVAEFVAYVRAIGASAGAGEAFLGPMAKPHRMALMTAGCVACAVISLAVSGVDGRWQSHVIGTVLGLVVVGGIVTSWRRLRVIASRLREADCGDAGSGSNMVDQAASE